MDHGRKTENIEEKIPKLVRYKKIAMKIEETLLVII